jgi:hypothetical protein
MSLSNTRVTLLTITALLATSACGGNGAVPSNAVTAGNAGLQASGSGITPDDNTSILKKLTKDVVIGSTVDPKNGDMAPHSLVVAKTTYGLKKGDLLVCNYEDSTGTAGNGTTVEVLADKPGSAPKTFAQSSLMKGCDGNAITSGNQTYAIGASGTGLVPIDQKGKIGKVIGPITAPFANGDAFPGGLYTPEDIFTSDSTGHVFSIGLGNYGQKKLIEVAKGFDVNGKTGWSELDAAGFAYYPKKDVLYITDGVDNTVVAFSHASNLLEKDEIVVQKGGKTFKCLHPTTTCGSLVLAGSPLNAPEAAAILPNGNLVVANTAGGNTLVELTPTGTVLDTEVVDTSKTQGIYGIVATGTNDTNTRIFFSDVNGNNVQELEP